GNHHGEFLRLALVVARHRDCGGVAVARQHDLGRLVEQLGIRLGDVEAAEGGGGPGRGRDLRQDGGKRDAGLEATNDGMAHREAPCGAAAVQLNRSAGRILSSRRRTGDTAINAPYRAGRICMKKATQCAEDATETAKMKRPRRESGVVRGSEIMKNEKISSEPLCS